MTPEQFRKLALSVLGAEESSHHRHPDYRLGGKVFATLGFPDETRAMVKLTPAQQAEFIHDYPQVFTPASGAWGRQGCTSVLLRKATKAVMQQAIEAARQNAQWAALAAQRRSRPAAMPATSKRSRNSAPKTAARKTSRR